MPVKKLKAKNRYEPIWDLYEDGVTQGSISRFLECREQFRLRYVFGWQTKARSTTTAFGSAFHDILANVQFKNLSVDKAVQRYLKGMGDLAPTQRESVSLMLAEVKLIIELYLEHYKKEHARWKFIGREQEFKITHEVAFPTGRIYDVPLRGVFDGIFERNKHIYLLETKTKGRIDELTLTGMLHKDVQTQLYLYVMSRLYPKKKIDGVCYDVVRNPQLRIGKTESLKHYLQRLKADIKARPDWYFVRLSVTLLPKDTEKWVHDFLDPVLWQIVQWWESIKDDPNNPWGSPYHFYNPGAFVNQYGRSDLFDAVTTEKFFSLERRQVPYPEIPSYHR